MRRIGAAILWFAALYLFTSCAHHGQPICRPGFYHHPGELVCVMEGVGACNQNPCPPGSRWVPLAESQGGHYCYPCAPWRDNYRVTYEVTTRTKE